MGQKTYMNTLTHGVLKLMALQFNFRPSLRAYLKSSDGWTRFTIGFKTETGTVEQAVCFKDGRVRVLKQIPEDADAVMSFVTDEVLREASRLTPNEFLNVILKNKVILYGNMAYLGAFNYFVSLLMGKRHQKKLDRLNRQEVAARKEEYGINNPEHSGELVN